MVLPAQIDHSNEHGIDLHTAHPLPPGERRAGLTGHTFTRYVIGQHQRIHTGWLTVDPTHNHALYAPHTAFGYRMPASTLLYRLVVGLATRRGARTAHQTKLSTRDCPMTSDG